MGELPEGVGGIDHAHRETACGAAGCKHAYPFGWYGQRAPVRHEPRHTSWYVCGGRGVAE